MSSFPFKARRRDNSKCFYLVIFNAFNELVFCLLILSGQVDANTASTHPRC